MQCCFMMSTTASTATFLVSHASLWQTVWLASGKYVTDRGDGLHYSGTVLSCVQLNIQLQGTNKQTHVSGMLFSKLLLLPSSLSELHKNQTQRQHAYF